MTTYAYITAKDLVDGSIVLGQRDGDTFKLPLLAGPDVISAPWLRLGGVDCPERGTVEGKLAKAFVLEKLKGATETRVMLDGTKSFDRLIANVRIDEFPLDVMLVEAGHAVSWTRSRYAHFGLHAPFGAAP
jgi:endonuclease YncB( thermonuclease family)